MDWYFTSYPGCIFKVSKTKQTTSLKNERCKLPDMPGTCWKLAAFVCIFSPHSAHPKPGLYREEYLKMGLSTVQ